MPSDAVAGAELFSVAAGAPDDAWAVGGPSSWGSATPQPTALTEHWDGMQWTVVPSAPVAGVLEGVAIAARDDVWAVGEQDRGAGALVEHWNGVEWRQVAVTGLRGLSAVAATSGRDVWTSGSDAGGAAVILHWAGSRWTRVARRPKTQLFDLVAISPRDVWAVGDETGRRFLEMHWDGKRWTSYSQLPPRTSFGPDYDPELVTVAASGHKDVWAAGNAADSGEPDYSDTVVLHWDGTRWRSVSPGVSLVWADSLAIRAPGDIVLAGLAGDVLGYMQDGIGPVVEHLSDHTWQRTGLDDGHRFDDFAKDRSGALWAVGYTGSGFTDDNGFPAQTTPLVERAGCA